MQVSVLLNCFGLLQWFILLFYLCCYVDNSSELCIDSRLGTVTTVINYVMTT